MALHLEFVPRFCAFQAFKRKRAFKRQPVCAARLTAPVLVGLLDTLGPSETGRMLRKRERMLISVRLGEGGGARIGKCFTRALMTKRHKAIYGLGRSPIRSEKF